MAPPGDGHAFICYAHADEKTVLPEIRWLEAQGIRVWYDQGISAGAIWRGEIAEAIDAASVVVFYVSEASVASEHCNREVHYALDTAKTVVPVYLEDVALTPDLRVGLTRVQALRRGDGGQREALLRAMGAGESQRAAPDPVSSRARSRSWGYAAVVLLVAASVGWWEWRRQSSTAPEVERVPSIAVLPFDNLSADAEDAYFTDGVHDEILARLAKVADLRVISRSSVMTYRDREQNARAISAELDARYLVEGTVRRFPNEVVVTAQLIDGRADTHVWVETYRREPSDLFGIQTEVAERIVRTLQANLSVDEVRRVRARPTDNPEAYDLYLRAMDAKRNRRGGALELLEQAVAVDPSFALAYAEMSLSHRSAYFFNFDAREERLDMAKEAVDRALELDPDLPEAHFALGMYHYARRDYPRAVSELETARLGLPNEIPVHLDLGFIYRRQGRFQDSVASFQAALDRAPLSGTTALYMGQTHLLLRDYATSARYLRRAYLADPNDSIVVGFNVLLHLRRGEFDEARTLLRRWDGGPDQLIGWVYIELLLWERDLEGARDFLEGQSWDALRLPHMVLARELLLGQLQNWLGDPDSAMEHLNAALKFLDAELQSNPDDHRLHAARGQALAALGRHDEAIEAGRHASALMPVSKDAQDGMSRLSDLASIYAAVGELERALELLSYMLSMPGGLSIEEVMRKPEWDSLRGHVDYAALVARHAR